MVEPNAEPLSGRRIVLDFIARKFHLSRLKLQPMDGGGMWLLTIADSQWEVQAFTPDECLAELARLVAQDLLETR